MALGAFVLGPQLLQPLLIDCSKNRGSMKFSDLKITRQLIVFFFFLLTVPLLGLSIFFYFQTVRIIQDTKNNLRYVSVIHENRLNTILQGFNRRFEDMRADSVFQDIFLDFLNVPSKENRLKVETAVVNRHISDGSFPDFFLLNQDGTVVFSSDQREGLGRNHASDSFFTTGKAARRWHIQKYGTTDVFAYLSGPYIRENQFFGVLVLRVDFAPFLSLHENFKTLNKTGELQLVEANGNGWRLITPTRFSTTTNPSSLTDRLYDQTMVLENNFFEAKDYRDRNVFAILRLLDEKNLGLIVKIDKDEVFLPLLLLARSIILIFSFLLAFGLVLIFFFYVHVTRPLAQLVRATKSIEKGEKNYDLPAESKNEIGILVTAFQRMTRNLLLSNSHLEKRVVERTLMLNKRIAQINNEKVKDDALLSSIGEGLIVTDKEGVILLVNQATATMFGIKKEDVSGSHFSEVVLLKNISGRPMPFLAGHPVFEALSGAKKTVGVEFISERFGGGSDGSGFFPLALTATPIVVNGQTIGSVAIVRDITKEKEVDRMKSEFISIASHQLRGPIASIKWYGELLGKQKGTFQKESREFVERINVSTEHLISLVNDFLNVSRIESGSLKSEPKTIHPSVLVKNIVETYQQEIEKKKITVRIKNRSLFKDFFMDPEMIREIYANLIANSIKYSKRCGNISIRLSDESETTDLVLEIKDDGVGIAKEEHGRIFTKFFRASNALEGGYKGTGLGLYTAQMLATQIGGRIWFESEKGHGATFWVRLPRKAK